MPDPSQTAAPTATWAIVGRSARTAAGRIELASPADGFHTATGDHLLGLDLRTAAGDPRLVDHWVRGDDVVAVYEPADPRRLRATAMWRRHDAMPAALELVVSAQTSLTESDSSLAVTCDLAGGMIRWAAPAPDDACGAIVWRPLVATDRCPTQATCLLVTRCDDAVLVAVHPADARRIDVLATLDRVHVACWLFSTAIEKGVLLRSRALAAIGPVADAGWADAMVAGFLASPPPLTA